MLIAILSRLLGNPVGRWFAAVLLVLCVIGVLAFWLFTKGRQAERALQMLDRLNTLQKVVQVNHAVRNMSPDQRRDALRRWVRD